ncbi:hypothetical protein ACA910_018118 [Epithemia clementina (nom. ined.)]
MLVQRQVFLRRLFALASWALAPMESAHAFSSLNPSAQAPRLILESEKVSSPSSEEKNQQKPSVVAYKELALPVREYGVEIPVGCWFPIRNEDLQSSPFSAQDRQGPLYNYRISVRKIGQMLAGWNFIPSFYAREFFLTPARAGVSSGSDVSLPKIGPVVILAHGFLGSRFDLSHLGEELAAEGFTCLACEYPESLAATYDRMDGLDRAIINDNLLKFIQNDLELEVTKFGIVGHSLGCRTVITTGDDRWARVLIAGGPRLPDGTAIPGNALFISSMNDGAMAPARFGGAQGYPRDIVLLQEDQLLSQKESVNDAMIEFLSALLPVAKAFEIPLLDFDRYQVSRDSRQTAGVVHPLIVEYLKQEMMRGP